MNPERHVIPEKHILSISFILTVGHCGPVNCRMIKITALHGLESPKPLSMLCKSFAFQFLLICGHIYWQSGEENTHAISLSLSLSDLSPLSLSNKNTHTTLPEGSIQRVEKVVPYLYQPLVLDVGEGGGVGHGVADQDHIRLLIGHRTDLSERVISCRVPQTQVDLESKTKYIINVSFFLLFNDFFYSVFYEILFVMF